MQNENIGFVRAGQPVKVIADIRNGPVRVGWL